MPISWRILLQPMKPEGNGVNICPIFGMRLEQSAVFRKSHLTAHAELPLSVSKDVLRHGFDTLSPAQDERVKNGIMP